MRKLFLFGHFSSLCLLSHMCVSFTNKCHDKKDLELGSGLHPSLFVFVCECVCVCVCVCVTLSGVCGVYVCRSLPYLMQRAITACVCVCMCDSQWGVWCVCVCSVH